MLLVLLLLESDTEGEGTTFITEGDEIIPELAGEFDAVKNGEDFVVWGSRRFRFLVGEDTMIS